MKKNPILKLCPCQVWRGVIEHKITRLLIFNPDDHVLGKTLDSPDKLDPAQQLITDAIKVLDNVAKTAKKVDDDKTFYTTDYMGLMKDCPVTDLEIPAKTTHRLTSDLIYTGRNEDQYLLDIYDDNKQEWVLKDRIFGWKRVRIVNQ